METLLSFIKGDGIQDFLRLE